MWGIGVGETVPSHICSLLWKIWTKWSEQALYWGMNAWHFCRPLTYLLRWDPFLLERDDAQLYFVHQSVLSFQEIRNGVTQKGETLSWLKSRLQVLIEVSSEKEAQKQGDELARVSSSFKALTTLLSEVYCLFTRHTVLGEESGRFFLFWL